MQKIFLKSTSHQSMDVYEVGEFFTIGSAPDNQLTLVSSEVAERHARIYTRGDLLLIRDMQSPNGVWVNQSRVLEAVVSLYDHIQIGPYHFQLQPEESKIPQLASKNEHWQNQLKKLAGFARTDLCVLITGPSGSGKELIAKQLHSQSQRANGPLLTINCGALSESLIESELFGHVKGSYTGATSDRKGAFEAARGGTLFLDEIGDLPLSLQPKLLRALENQEIRPVGADRSHKTDVRVLAATHKNLEQLVRRGQFREDLFFRLNICRINPPALVRRMEDFDDLLYQFAKKFKVRISHLALLQLREHPWPGNIRELSNMVARASAHFPGQYILPEHLTDIIDALPLSPSHEILDSRIDQTVPIIKEFEKGLIMERLMINRGNQRRTAAELGMPKSTLHDRLKTYQINVKELVPQVR